MYSDFTDAELEAIAEKLRAVSVDGPAFSEVATDPEKLVKYVQLSIGHALHFSRYVNFLGAGARGLLLFTCAYPSAVCRHVFPI